MMRKLFVTLSLSVIAGILSPISAHAAVATFSCTGSDGNASSASYTVTSGVLTNISNCYGALTLDSSVTQIDYATYANNVTSIVIPATTATIGQQPFTSPLTSITVASANPNYKSDSSGVLYTKDGTTLVQYPRNAPGSTYTVPSGTTTIGWCGFSAVMNLQTVVVPSSVTTMSNGFNNCFFPSTSSLQAINVNGANAFYSSIDGVLLSKTQNTLFQYPIGKRDVSYTVPSTVTSIQANAFALNPFDQNVILPNGLLSIGTYAFYENTGITSITIPASLTTFGNYPFLGASNLTAINVDNANTVVKSLSGVVYSKDGTQLIEYPDGKTDTNFVIPNGVTTVLAQWVWTNPFLINVTVPSTVTTIGSGYLQSRTSKLSYLIFSGNSSLTSISGAYAATVIYCGTNNSAISTHATTLSLVKKCETAAPAFTLSNSKDVVEVGKNIIGFASIASSTPDFYTISPSVGDGLTFNDTTGSLSGTPLNSAPPTTYLITGVNAFGSLTAQYSLRIDGIMVPDPVQQSKITSMTPTSSTASVVTAIVVNGTFFEKVSAIQVNGIGLAAGSWVQTPTTISFAIPGKSVGTYSIQVFNGSVPVLAAQSFTVNAAPVIKPVPVAPSKPKVTYIQCSKPGNGTRTVYGVNPVCPSGYVKK
jgi:hypothetical protein